MTIRIKYRKLLGYSLAGFLFLSNTTFAYAQNSIVNIGLSEEIGQPVIVEDITNTEDGQNVTEFLEEVEKVDDYAVYTNELTNTIGHEDGEVMIAQLDQSTTILIKGDSQGNQGADYDNNVKSIVASTSNEDITVSINSNSQVTEEATDNLKTLEYGSGVNVTNTTNGCNYVQMTEEETQEVIEEIANQLDTLAQSGQEIIMSNTYTAEDGVELIKSVVNYLDGNDELDNTDTVTITIPSTTLSEDSVKNDWNNNKILKQLLDANKNGVQVIINVSTDADVAEIVIDRNMSNEVQQYGATNLIWNFGDYAGTIKGAQIIGTVIAGNATVSIGEVQSGSVAADKVGHSAEIHLNYDGNTPLTPEEPEEPDTPSEPSTPTTPNTTEESNDSTDVVTIEDDNTPLAVLGATRNKNNNNDIEVLGANRRPSTGDYSEIWNYSFVMSLIILAMVLTIKKGRQYEKENILANN